MSFVPSAEARMVNESLAAGASRPFALRMP